MENSLFVAAAHDREWCRQGAWVEQIDSMNADIKCDLTSWIRIQQCGSSFITIEVNQNLIKTVAGHVEQEKSLVASI